MSKRRMTIAATLVLSLLTNTPAFAQGQQPPSRASSSIPTAASFPAPTSSSRTSTRARRSPRCLRARRVLGPRLITGTYTVTVSLQGFKTAVLNNVVVNSGVPANVRATLEVGGLTEDGDWSGQLRARADADGDGRRRRSTRVRCRACRSRAATPPQFIVFLPGVSTPGGTRDSIVNGLPQAPST